MKKAVYAVIDWTWGFPQTFIGWILSKTLYRGCKRRRTETSERFCVSLMEVPLEVYNARRKVLSRCAGVSLGRYIFLNCFELTKEDIAHECGHSVQSRMTGPLYLLVVGIPSMFGNILARFNARRARTYYEHYPEAWADRLGGVERRWVAYYTPNGKRSFRSSSKMMSCMDTGMIGTKEVVSVATVNF